MHVLGLEVQADQCRERASGRRVVLLRVLLRVLLHRPILILAQEAQGNAPRERRCRRPARLQRPRDRRRRRYSGEELARVLPEVVVGAAQPSGAAVVERNRARSKPSAVLMPLGQRSAAFVGHLEYRRLALAARIVHSEGGAVTYRE